MNNALKMADLSSGRDSVETSREPLVARVSGCAIRCAVACAVGWVLMAGCTASPGLDRLTHETNPKAVQEVLAGERETASAAWWGFDEQDSTECLQAAIRSGARTLVVPNLGKPWLVRPLLLESNQEIVFEPGVVVMAKPGDFLAKGASLFTAQNKENLTLRGKGASWVMHKHDYQKPPYEKAEWRNCLSLRGCKNILVQGLRLASSGGDGIYVGRGTGEWIHCRDVTIRDVVCEDHHRQGISVITAENLLIEHCTLADTSGTAPQAGIDYEPNQPDEHLVNCVLRDCDIQGNAGCGILMYLGSLRGESEPISIVVENCRVRDNRAAALSIVGFKKCGDLRGTVVLQGNKMTGKQVFDDWSRLNIDTRQ